MRAALHLAFALLTRLPLPPAPAFAPHDHGRAVAAYPLVGLALGGLLLLVAQATAPLSPLLQAVLLTTLWVLLTGGLHLDGLADSADAWIGGLGDRERTLTIMKDPRSGPAAITAITLTLMLKSASLAALLPQGGPVLWLLLPPLAGRAALTALFLTLPYARPDGMGAQAAAHLPRPLGWGVLGVAALLPPWLLGMGPGLILLGVGLGGFLLLRHALRQRLGGFTGDGAGAVCELTETLALLTLAAAP